MRICFTRTIPLRGGILKHGWKVNLYRHKDPVYGLAVVTTKKAPHLDLCSILYAFSDPLRIEIIKTLLKKDAASCKGACSRASISKSTLSHHFKILRESGIVQSQKNGVEHINTLRLKELNRCFPGLVSSIMKHHR